MMLVLFALTFKIIIELITKPFIFLVGGTVHNRWRCRIHHEIPLGTGLLALLYLGRHHYVDCHVRRHHIVDTIINSFSIVLAIFSIEWWWWRRWIIVSFEHWSRIWPSELSSCSDSYDLFPTTFAALPSALPRKLDFTPLLISPPPSTLLSSSSPYSTSSHDDDDSLCYSIDSSSSPPPSPSFTQSPSSSQSPCPFAALNDDIMTNRQH